MSDAVVPFVFPPSLYCRLNTLFNLRFLYLFQGSLYTVMSGSVSRGKNDPSQSLQMMARSLMTPDDLKSIPKSNFVVIKTGPHPMTTKLRLFLDWGIRFGEPYKKKKKAH